MLRRLLIAVVALVVIVAAGRALSAKWAPAIPVEEVVMVAEAEDEDDAADDADSNQEMTADAGEPTAIDADRGDADETASAKN
jgi:ABC-type microcin C transport system permease subunit YejB